ncbi:hypothetical protein KVV02_001999 [Mortierella alpina]|uniref:GMC oxidoreductase n=1 Tax=Mortierella alpina TaxID=64518 RepID=A0A9P8A4J7_MORAP|nr:hypothetical protein KVV02_001999 [Mortierella alpina]
MSKDSFYSIATAAAGLGMAGLAYHYYDQSKKETGRDSWSVKKDAVEYDYIILGGGTAGCVLASRLAEDPAVSVLILEAGEDMDRSNWTQIPFGSTLLVGSKHDWQLKTVPQVHANGRVLVQTRGRMLGGCTNINGMQYTRGPPSDFDEWDKTFGNPGWSFEEVLPYFKKSECFHDPGLDRGHPRGPQTDRVHDPDFDTFEPKSHGTEGPWMVSYHHLFASSKAFIKASMEEGIPYTRDPNGSSMLGVFRMQTSMRPNATRSSASNAFLGPKNVPGGGSRGRIRVVPTAHVERILISTFGDGVKRAAGAEFRHGKRDDLQTVHARREVLLCAGVFQSPALLLASGIGHPIHDSIPLLHSLPGVGKNMTDHVGVALAFEAAADCETLYTAFAPSNLGRLMYQYYRHGTGPLTSQVIEAGCFVRLEEIAPEFVAREKANGTWQERSSGPNAPHIELLFPPCYVKVGEYGSVPDKAKNYYSIIAVLLNPASKGTTRVKVTEVHSGNNQKESNPRLKIEPQIDCNFLAEEFDLRVMREAIRFARKIGRRMQQDPLLGGVECFPGEAAVPSDDDAALDMFTRQECNTYYHSVGTCSMGPASNSEAVVDARLKVHGVESLRVVDSSVIPKVIAGK